MGETLQQYREVKYSIVVPVYNSAPGLPLLYSLITQVMADLQIPGYEIVFVNDFSIDNSQQVLEQIASKDPRIKNLQLNGNHGQQTATLCGIENAIGDIIITIDDDMQTPPSEISKLLLFFNANNYVMVYGYSPKLYQGFIKRIFPLAAKLLFDYAILPRYRHINYFSSFRVFNKSIIFPNHNNKARNLFFIWQIDYRKITSINVEHIERKYGKTNYNIIKTIAFFYDWFLIAGARLWSYGFAASIVLLVIHKILFGSYYILYPITLAVNVFMFLICKILLKKREVLDYKLAGT